ncbi:MAG: hypothetical protein HRU41_40765 [Saprospiraceae bacterium]|nr:hypothetical protein [Saprospiraceae bacterium]
MGSCSLVFANQFIGPVPVAVILSYNEATKEADSTGSAGDEVRLRIVRSGVIQETTPGEANTGTNQISYTTMLQNGDQLCLQASYSGFSSFDQDCGTIPTPEFGFVPIT